MQPRLFWQSTLAPIVTALVVVGVVRTAAAEMRYVPSGSMEPTLLVGDLLLTSKYPYGYSRFSPPVALPLPEGRLWGDMPRRGDVVTFALPGDPTTTYVKRVIALPGERVQYRSGRLVLNGSVVPRRADGTAGRFVETLPGGVEHVITEGTDHGTTDDTREITVPPGHLFVLGDNRDNSLDSRVPVRFGGVGLLPADHLIGRVEAVVVSADLDGPAFRLDRIGQRVR